MQDFHLKVDAKHICQFLMLCGGNWHACIYVSCQNCSYQHPCEIADFLFLPDATGKPCVLPIKDARILFARTPEADECLFHISWRVFVTMYQKLFEPFAEEKNLCPIKRLLKQEVDACYEW